MATGRLAAEYLTSDEQRRSAGESAGEPSAGAYSPFVGRSRRPDRIRVAVPRDAGIPDVPLPRTSAVRPRRSSVSRQSCPQPVLLPRATTSTCAAAPVSGPPPVPSRPRPVPEAPTPRPVWTGFLPRRGTPAGHRHPSWTRMKISETMITSTVRRPETRATLSRRRSRMFRPAARSRRTSQAAVPTSE
jgi:hypothetical protein